VPRELFALAGDLGLFAAVPERFGGAGIADFRYSTVFAEEAARRGDPGHARSFCDVRVPAANLLGAEGDGFYGLTLVDAAKAKWWSTELQGRTMDTCVQLHGGYGYMLDYPIARAWADSRVSRIYGGSTEIMKEIIGRSLGLG
jgi:alkylation response protein AidB-like acyl-CoA dehydrogenase